MYAQDAPEAELASSKLQRAGAPSRADSREQAGRGALAFLILTPKTRRWLGVLLMDVAPSIENFSASCGALTPSLTGGRGMFSVVPPGSNIVRGHCRQ